MFQRDNKGNPDNSDVRIAFQEAAAPALAQSAARVDSRYPIVLFLLRNGANPQDVGPSLNSAGHADTTGSRGPTL